MVLLSARQATQIFGWARPKRILTWNDVVRRKLTLDQLIGHGLGAMDLVLLQPDPSQWVQHAGATLRHARFMLPWEANPFVHFGADLADVLSMRLTVVEMVRMAITYRQLKEHGMNDEIERMFKLEDEEWEMLGRPVGPKPV